MLSGGFVVRRLNHDAPHPLLLAVTLGFVLIYLCTLPLFYSPAIRFLRTMTVLRCAVIHPDG